MAIAAGSRIGQYEVISLLGVGGMGEVYRARDTRLNRDRTPTSSAAADSRHLLREGCVALPAKKKGRSRGEVRFGRGVGSHRSPS